MNEFMQRVISDVGDEVLLYDYPQPYSFPIYNGEEVVGKVYIKKLTSTEKRTKRKKTTSKEINTISAQLV